MSARPNRVFRSPYAGVIQILRFNWPWYALALILCAAAVLYVIFARPLASVASTILLMTCIAAFWSLASLWVSHLVYDRSEIADGGWIDDALSSRPFSIANFHAGVDETSDLLSEKFPSARLAIFDFYDPDTMSEPSIRRARRISRALPGSVPIDFRKIPLGDGTEDAAFVVFAAHELRTSSALLLFFREIRRVLRPGGSLIVVEHLRDPWNLLAFGPGSLHFLSRDLWLRAFSDTGFELLSARRVTPFVSVFRLRPIREAPAGA